MRYTKTILLVSLGCFAAAYGQSQTSVQPPFAGCYEVETLVWSPADDTIRLIPKRFQLLNETWQPNRSVFLMRSLPASGDRIEKLWTWEPKGDRVWISWSTGFGGFKGTLKPSRTGELVGKLKEWCDGRCGWKKRTGAIQVRKTDCTETLPPASRF